MLCCYCSGEQQKCIRRYDIVDHGFGSTIGSSGCQLVIDQLVE